LQFNCKFTYFLLISKHNPNKNDEYDAIFWIFIPDFVTFLTPLNGVIENKILNINRSLA